MRSEEGKNGREKYDRGKEIRFSFENVFRFTEFATLNAHMLVPRLYPFTMKGLVTV